MRALACCARTMALTSRRPISCLLMALALEIGNAFAQRAR